MNKLWTQIKLIPWILWVIFTDVILGKGVRMMMLAATDICIFCYAGDQFLKTTGTEKAIYLLIIQMGVLTAIWHLNIVEKDRNPEIGIK